MNDFVSNTCNLDDLYGFFKDFHGDVQGRKKADLVFCCQAEDSVFHALCNNIGSRLCCLDSDHKAQAADTFHTGSILECIKDKSALLFDRLKKLVIDSLEDAYSRSAADRVASECGAVVSETKDTLALFTEKGSSQRKSSCKALGS